MAWSSVLSSTKKLGNGMGFPPIENDGGVKLLNLVYFATPESRGRNVAHAASTWAAAPRNVSCDAFALQLVRAARAPT